MSDLFAPAADLSCHACGHVHTSACMVRLVDGSMVSNHSEAWRVECEARTILDVPFGSRRMRLNDIERARGKEAADELRILIARIWEAERQTQAA